MKIELIDFRSKTWGLVKHPHVPNHFHTGWEGMWNTRDGWELNRTVGCPKANMEVGKNVIIEGSFRVTGQSRGRSAANFHGHFRDHETIPYDLSMDGTGELLQLLQDGKFHIEDGYIVGRYTLAKQGTSFFLRPESGK